MKFTNRLKGTLTQAIAEALWGHSYYRVTPLGVEQIIREVTSLNKDSYNELGLSKSLKSLPDFFVTNSIIDKHWLVEVKYRSEWNDKVAKDLASKLKKQVKLWQPLYLMVFLGTPSAPAEADSDLPKYSMGIIKLIFKDGKVFAETKSSEEKCMTSLKWDDFNRIQDEFTSISNNWPEETLRKAKSIINGLSLLE